MRFIEFNYSKPPIELPAIGKVGFVAYRRFDPIVMLYPNNAVVNGRVLAAHTTSPEEAWDMVLNNPRLLNEFGIEQ